MELTGKAQMEKTSARGKASSGMRDISRRERIALAVDEFYESIEHEIRYIAEWYEIEAYELLRATVASTDAEGTETQDPIGDPRLAFVGSQGRAGGGDR
jgi:hypothetical protein